MQYPREAFKDQTGARNSRHYNLLLDGLNGERH